MNTNQRAFTRFPLTLSPRLITRAAVLFGFLLLTGCASWFSVSAPPVVPPQSQYDSIITDNSGRLLSINQLADRLAPADVVVIGEYHGHHASHLLQSLLQSALYQRRPEQVLSMEQFTVEEQSALDAYLSGQSGEEELIADTDAWSNYKASYRPLVEFSKSRNIPVVAANAPVALVRCVGRQGPSYLDGLETDQRQWVPENPFMDTPGYQRKFFDAMGSGHGQTGKNQRLENSYKAQLLRDNTMAERVITALERNPGHQVIHLTGTFHSENRLGMVAVLEQKRPGLKVAVVSPVFWRAGDTLETLLESHRNRGDFLYFLQPLPEEFKDPDRHRDAIIASFRKAADLACD